MIQIEVTGRDDVSKKLAAVSNPAARAGILSDFGAYLVDETSDRFETETAPDGTPWQQSLRARDEGGQTLTDTGILAGSITYNSNAQRLEVGTATQYAAIHQFGGDIVPKNAKALMFQIGGRFIQVQKVTMPARPFLGITDGDEAELVNIVHDHWQEALQ